MQKQIDKGLILELRAQLEHAIQDDDSFSVIACVAWGLPGEDFEDVISVAWRCLRKTLRDDDRAGRLDRATLILGLPGTSYRGSKSLASRLIGDFTLRTAHLRPTNWRTGIATYPQDGVQVQALVDAAIEATRDARMTYARKSIGRA